MIPTAQSARRIPFGVGSFAFAPIASRKMGFTGNEFADEIRRVLTQIPNVDQVDVWLPEDQREERYEVPSIRSESMRGWEHLPSVFGLTISFRIHISFSTQQELLGDSRMLRTSDSEEFFVFIVYGFAVPVSYVVVTSENDDDHPSSAVLVVREYLVKACNQEKNSWIKFAFIGPTPFHCEFFVAPTYSQDSAVSAFEMDTRLKLDLKELPGYDEVTIFCENVAPSLSASDLIAQVTFHLGVDLDLYYEVTTELGVVMFEWSKVQRKVKRVIKNESMNGLRAAVYRILRRSSTLRRTTLSLLKFESHLAATKIRLMNKSKAHVSLAGKFVTSKVEHEISGLDEYSMERLGRALEYLENRQSRLSELLVVVGASVIGALIGSIATLLLTQ